MVLATAGSAVGLGNVWRFPYMAGQNGGATFIIIYIVCVLLLGLPCILGEFIIGRHGAANTARAYSRISGGSPWRFVGYMGVLTGFLITGYYAVVSGWCLQYIFASFMGELNGDPAYISRYFADFSSSPLRPVLWTVAILAATHFIIIRGVRQGIERASKAMMPTLFILLLIVVVSSCMLPGASKGVEFLFRPDFSKMNGSMLLAAMGQSFYSLSIGMGCLCTFASYFSRQTNLVRSAANIIAIDTFIAILAGLMIFPAAFSVGINPDSGPSLISLHEVSTAFLSEEFRMPRPRAALVITVVCSVIGAFCSLSIGGRDWLVVCGKSLFDVFDFVTGQLLLPFGGFLTCIYLGWFAPRKTVRDEFTNWGTLSGRFFSLYLLLVRFVCPICIMLIFLNQLGLIG